MTTIDELPQLSHGPGAYVPGACNIGAEEIRMRRIFGIGGLVVTVLFGASLVVADAPSAARWLVALPLAGSFIGLLQARRRFCVNFALRGLANFGGRDDAVRIRARAARRADLRAAVRLVAEASLLALVTTALFVILPI